MKNIIENQITKFVSKNKIIKRSILSQAFNINCEKITLDNNKSLVAKYYIIENTKFNSIESETKSLIYLLKKFPHIFPSVKYFTETY